MPVDEVARSGVYGLWSNSEQVLPLFTYARTSRRAARPLYMAGIDPKLSKAALASYPTWLFRSLEEAGQLEARDREELQRAFARFPNVGKMQKLSREERETDRGAFVRLLADVSKAGGRFAEVPDLQLIRRTLANIVALYDWHEAVHADVSTTIPWMTTSRSTTFAIAPWRTTSFGCSESGTPTRKIIIWAASMHIARDTSAVDARATRFNPLLYEGFKSMGAVAGELLGDQVYRIGFTSFDGDVGITGQPRVEGRGCSTGREHRGLSSRPRRPLRVQDFRSAPDDVVRSLGGRRPGAFFGHVPFVAEWPRLFDGVFFIRTMWPSTSSHAAPGDR